jgi:hypothetical protein
LEGSKSIETRDYPLPTQLLNTPILLLQTAADVACKSSLNDSLVFPADYLTTTVTTHATATADHAMTTAASDKQPASRIIGAVVFSRCHEYTSAAMWSNDESRHLVAADSAYGWSQTKTKFGWIVSSTLSYDQTMAHVYNKKICIESDSNNDDKNSHENSQQGSNICSIFACERIYRSFFEVQGFA